MNKRELEKIRDLAGQLAALLDEVEATEQWEDAYSIGIWAEGKLVELEDKTGLEPQFHRDRHGGLYDRGGADSYYHRPWDPHWYPEGTGKGIKVTDLTPEEIAEYNAGYDDNENSGNKKDWG